MAAHRRRRPLPPRRVFVARMVHNGAVAAGIVIISLAMGACGYHYAAGLGWLDATLNASMILTGMGPVDPLKTNAAKVFAIFYSIFSGVVFLGAVAVVLAPVLHRFLHRFHIDIQPDESADQVD